MNIRTSRLALALIAVLVMAASLSFAGAGRFRLGKSSTGTKSVTVTLPKAAKLNDATVLEAGPYTVKFSTDTPSPEVEFYKDGTLVAKALAKVETRPERNISTAVETGESENTNVIYAIDPSGLAEKLVFAEPQ
jgi:hypothetical protein